MIEDAVTVLRKPRSPLSMIRADKSPSCTTSIIACSVAGGSNIYERCLAEFIGTGMIVHFGCGVCCSAMYAKSGISPFGQAFIWGSAVACAIFSTRDVSGAHLNPAITASILVNRSDQFYGDPFKEAPAYILAQFAGATTAAAVNYTIFRHGITTMEKNLGLIRGSPASTASYAGAFGLVPNPVLRLGLPTALISEAWMTGAFTYVIFGLTDPETTVPTTMSPMLVGTTVVVFSGVFGTVTGCGMNPARDLGPRLITSMTGWGRSAFIGVFPAYTIGPLLGAVAGGALYERIHVKKPEVFHDRKPIKPKMRKMFSTRFEA